MSDALTDRRGQDFDTCKDCDIPSACLYEGRCRRQLERREVSGRLRALGLAKAAVTARGAAYGKPEDLFARIAKRWSMTLGVTVTPAQVAICMIDLKVERWLNGTGGPHLDTAVDIAGYAACLYEVSEGE
jgi:hypothetical protein